MKRSEALEIERKYDVGPEDSVPDLAGITGVARVDDGGTVVLEAVYYDLATRDLLRYGITLRRRHGGADEGWHIKFPAAPHRLEVHVPLAAADEAVPAEVLDLVRVHVRTHPLIPVARLTTTRTITTLIGSAGSPLIEICDDLVDSEDLTTGATRSWREWEAEVVGADAYPDDEQAGVADAVEDCLLNAGASPSLGGPKLATALGGIPESSHAEGKPGSVRNVLTASFRRAAADLLVWDLRFRRNEEGSLHQLRVRSRTLRSMLKTYRPLLDAERADRLEERLKLMGGTLSAARDAEVMQDLVRKGVARQPPGTIPRHVIRRLEKMSAAQHQKALARVLRSLNSTDYFTTLDALDDFTSSLPLKGGKKNGGKAASLLPPAVKRQQARVLELARQANRETDLDAQLERLHDVRKKSKRLRYALRSVDGSSGFSFGAQMGKSMKSSEKIQDILGTHHDSVLFQQFLLKVSRAARRAGDNTFAYGVLHEAEHSIQRAAEADFRERIATLD
ncbi:CYTH and CHAD domain-containing protein [Arthrobacter sp. CAN_A1]|uniref:CYTH and CHAD domain-containing protein n=1 Tax=Arthrobacter sp. CAN_A1 TaxID=2787717 RepID=UPI0018C9341A